MRIDPADIQLVRDVPIVNVLERFGVLTRGRAAFCPFHVNERTPAAAVYPDQNRLYCFSCGKGWDPIAFYREWLQLTFVEAVQAIAADFGFTLRHQDPRKARREQIAQKQAWREAERIIAARDAYRRELIERRNLAYDLERRAIRLSQQADNPDRAELLREIVFIETGAGLDAEERLKRLEQASPSDLLKWFHRDPRTSAA